MGIEVQLCSGWVSGKGTFGFVKSCSFLIYSCLYEFYLLFVYLIYSLDLFQIGIKMISVASLADSGIPQANLFCEYFPAVDRLLKRHVLEPFDIHKQRCERGAGGSGLTYR